MTRGSTETENETHALGCTAAAKLIQAARRRSCKRRMRDSNSRGVAPNTLSNNAARRSPAFTTVRGLREHEDADAGERRRTGVNETETETGSWRPLRGSTSEERRPAVVVQRMRRAHADGGLLQRRAEPLPGLQSDGLQAAGQAPAQSASPPCGAVMCSRRALAPGAARRKAQPVHRKCARCHLRPGPGSVHAGSDNHGW
jgi:hypothetical protein